LLVLWIVLAVAAFMALFVIQQARAPGRVSAAAWLRGGALLLLLLVGLRFGLRVLPLVGPVGLWLIWGLLRAPQGGTSAGSAAGRRTGMSRDEALQVLGLTEGASEERIRAAHRQLIKKLHPDQGGSSLLAQQVNEAKQVLLGR
jgi:hypothetical protein